MEQNEQLESIMGLIMHGGTAKSHAVEAIALAKEGNFAAAKEKLRIADEELIHTHHAQSGMLTKEAQGQKIPFSLLLVHGQDHLMTSITFVDLAKEIVSLYEQLKYGNKTGCD
ncbi:PTS lactose/cellobiose transporter subunit IIA [Streptococcus sp. ZJ93]|uniref:PTS lactose/cellobiose transporter subunit IIA n=1 Tax=Streptococcus handemini TaxID=3161188 RepID=UPI0032EEE0AD